VIAVFLSILLSGSPLQAAVNSETESTGRQSWTAEWIAHPTASLRDRGVFHYRKLIHLATKPEHYPVEVSADNHFVLYVNGERIGDGPAKSDLPHWRYESYDLAKSLHAGDNVIAATVWNFGMYAPLAVISDRTAFLMQGDDAAEADVNTDTTWDVEEEKGEGFIPRVGNGFMMYWAADPGELMDGQLYDWGWKDAGVSDHSHWVKAAGVMRETIYPKDSVPLPYGRDTHTRWVPMPDPLPPMEFTEVASGKVVRTNLPAAQQFPARPVEIPPHTETEILVDRGEMITGFPTLTVSGGAGSTVSIGYTEALYDAHQRRGNRNEVANRQVLGKFDTFLPDGGQGRTFTPLWFRTWRYFQLKIKTADEPLRLDSLHVDFSAFPFVERAAFTSSDPELEAIWKICWRTARLGAHDTYMDTPFWEQLQYVDDTRVQALISYTVPGDPRLALQALHAFDWSRIPDGITQSRYPASLQQFIPLFSLSYVDMLRDYWMYVPDEATVKTLLPGTRPILEWFLERMDDDGFLQKLPYSSFSRGPQEKSALNTLTLIDTLQQAAEMEERFGEKYLAEKYRAIAKKASQAVYTSCWDASLGLLADSPEKNRYTQYTNIYGVLTDAIPVADQANVMRKIIASNLGEQPSTKIVPVDLHAQFYLSRAIDKSGVGAEYLKTIAPWHQMLAKGMTTTPEFADPTRSDTHAWSAHPIYDMLTIVAGIHPASPGFVTVRIAPNPGSVEHFEATMPHPRGEIQVRYRHEGDQAHFTITLPHDVHGTMTWNGLEHALHSGEQELRLTTQPAQ
jgi:hypothetical protein